MERRYENLQRTIDLIRRVGYEVFRISFVLYFVFLFIDTLWPMSVERVFPMHWLLVVVVSSVVISMPLRKEGAVTRYSRRNAILAAIAIGGMVAIATFLLQEGLGFYRIILSTALGIATAVATHALLYDDEGQDSR